MRDQASAVDVLTPGEPPFVGALMNRLRSSLVRWQGHQRVGAQQRPTGSRRDGKIMLDDRRQLGDATEQDDFLLEPVKVANVGQLDSAERQCSIYCRIAVSAASNALFTSA